ncbi:MAG: DNA-protecting protein DprA [Gemmataceae bacterium]|nr:DNA-protecting protein DprA [Gemmataceae bacterium]
MLTLQLVPGLGPRLTAGLLERFGSAVAALGASVAELRQVPFLGEKVAAAIHAMRETADVDAELDCMARHDVHLRVLGSPDYPAALASIYTPPPLLYVRGTLDERDARAVAVVGSRRCTAYGKRVVERLAADLARAGYTVVSGLARGTDGYAHRGALEAGGRTVAVLAGGLAHIYPPEHKDLAAQVALSGALVTESAMAQGPLATLFPARNRIISALSLAVVVVEAAERSGALITAEHAAEQGRSVLAVPGPIDSPASAGTNALIRDGAILCRGAEDVLEELEGVKDRGPPPGSAVSSPPPSAGPPPGLDETQRRVWDFLAEGPRHLDEMVQRLGVPVPQLSGLLLTLEMRKAVRRLPGNRYERC